MGIEQVKIPVWNIPHLKKALATMSKKAEKLGLEPIHFQYISRDYEQVVSALMGEIQECAMGKL